MNPTSRRGRILQALASRSDTHAELGGDETTAPTAESQDKPQRSTPAITLRGRGGLLQRLARATRSPEDYEEDHQQSAPSQVAPTSRAAPQTVRQAGPSEERSSSGNESSGSPRLVRQDSDVSGSSLLSQQFAKIELQSLKASLHKNASTSGVPITLGLNYMTFETKTGIRVEEYHVDFNPQIESIRLRYVILRRDESKARIGEVMHWNGTNLYLPIKLPDKITSFTSTHPVTNGLVHVKLTYIKTPPLSELLPFYNSLMHKVMNRLDYVIINRQHYSPLHKIAIEQHRLEVWPGWLTSIQKLDGGIKLSVDATFRVLRLQTVLDIMIEIKTRNVGGRLREILEQELIGTIIMTRYNNRSYRIDEIDTTKKPTDTFTRSDGSEISFADYIRQHWNVEVKDLKQPMIVNRPKPKLGQAVSEPVYLIPELCCTTGLTEDMRSNYNIMKAIGDHTRLPPQIRENKLTEFLHQLATDERAKSILDNWGLEVRPTLDVVEGRRLDNETLLFGNQKTYRVTDEVDWTRPATGGSVFKSVDIDNWVLMCPDSQWNFAEDFMNSLKDVCRNLGIKFCAPRLVKLPNDSTLTYINAAKQNVRRTDQMVVLLTPGKTQREDRYSACKRLYTCDLAVPCQFIRCGTIANERRIRSVCQKVAIQILSKVGGQPWAMRFPMKSFMIVGIDVYHDTVDRKKSCLAFVASMNEFTSSWWSQTFFQNSLEEIGQKLNGCMITALKRFHSMNGYVPERIIVYRDGVGDGQLDSVLEIEIAQISSGIKFYMRDSHAGVQEPTISYIIIQKRINTKLSLRVAGNRAENPRPGSFLDHTITHPEYNDFYLVSQHVNQGTVSPTKYIVLTETGTLKPEHHQKLAYKMTHMYYNWCGTIRVPAPCQYAHKLAYLTGQNIRQQASERLEDKLYYL